MGGAGGFREESAGTYSALKLRALYYDRCSVDCRGSARSPVFYNCFLLCARRSMGRRRHSRWRRYIVPPSWPAACCSHGLEYLPQREFQWRRIKPNCVALLLSPLALGAHLSFLRWRFGSWNIISEAQASEGWGRSLTLPWNTLLNNLQHISSSRGYHGAFEFFFTLALLGLTIFACFRLRSSYAIYSVVSVLFITSWGDLTSAPRFGLVIFPVVLALALLGHNKKFNRAYIVVSAVLAAISMVVFSQWGWVA